MALIACATRTSSQPLQQRAKSAMITNRRLPIVVVNPLPSRSGRVLACGRSTFRSGLRKAAAGCVGAGDGGRGVLGGFGSETFASARFISSWVALSSAMAFELSLATCCWFALSCSMVRSRFARSRAIVCSNCV